MRTGRVILAMLLLLPCGCRKKPLDSTLALQRAVGKADRAQVLSLLAAGADINARDRYGATPLHGAATVGHKRMVDLLIAHGADVDANDASDGMPLHCAAQWGHPGVTRSLIAAGANVNSKGSWYRATPLKVALMLRHIEVAVLLLAGGANPNIPDEWGRTVLHDAAFEGRTDFAELFLRHGAQVNARDVEGLSPLHEAVWENHPEMVQLLLAHGADVNGQDVRDQTPLHVAALIANKGLSSVLIEKGADARANDDQGLTPLDYMRLPAAQPMVILRVDGKSPYSVIMANPSTIRRFLRGERIEFERVWIPRQKDVEGIDLKAAIEANPHIKTKTSFDLEYILGHLQEYNREYAGFISEGRKCILCNMALDESFKEPHNGRFSWGFDGGCSLARVIVDLADKTVVRIDCNGN